MSEIANTYSEFQSLPDFVYASNTSAVILPLFFHDASAMLKHCASVETCALL